MSRTTYVTCDRCGVRVQEEQGIAPKGWGRICVDRSRGLAPPRTLIWMDYCEGCTDRIEVKQ
jgi:hypothetical protein